MADLIALTDTPIRMAAAGRQERYLALDVTGYDSLDLQLYVPRVEGTSVLAVFKITTSMQLDADVNSWSDVIAFAPVTQTNQERMITIDRGFLRFIRWEFASLSGTSPAVTFTITGVARRFF